MKKKIILFLDVDGVLSIYQQGASASPWFRETGFSAWPIPNTKLLLRLIAEQEELHPVWLSCWGSGALTWNFFSKTRLFPVGYSLSSQAEKAAYRLFPHLYRKRVDSKLIAANYYLRKYPGMEVVWLEDGFTEEVQEWGKLPGIKLFDTTQDTIRSLLLSEDIGSAHDIVSMILGEKSRGGNSPHA